MLSLLAALLSMGQVEDALALPLVRVAAETLTVRGLDMLQIAAAGKIQTACTMSCRHIARALLKVPRLGADFLLAAFKHYPQHRDMILHDTLGTVLPNMRHSKTPVRIYPIGEGKQASIQAVSALLLRIIQVIRRTTLPQG